MWQTKMLRLGTMQSIGTAVAEDCPRNDAQPVPLAFRPPLLPLQRRTNGWRYHTDKREQIADSRQQCRTYVVQSFGTMLSRTYLGMEE